MLVNILRESGEQFDRLLRRQRFRLNGHEIGRLRQIGGGIAKVTGLPGVNAMDLLRFNGGVKGIAFNLDLDEIGVVLLDHHSGLKAGSEVHRTGQRRFTQQLWKTLELASLTYTSSTQPCNQAI